MTTMQQVVLMATGLTLSVSGLAPAIAQQTQYAAPTRLILGGVMLTQVVETEWAIHPAAGDQPPLQSMDMNSDPR